MISFTTYLIESAFSSQNWSHNGKFDYCERVISKLLSGETIYCGVKTRETPVTIDMFDVSKLKALYNSLLDSSYKDFDKCVLPKYKNTVSWTKLFKGDFSGYDKGLASKNKGNAFEEEFVKNFFSIYKQELESALRLKTPIVIDDLENSISSDGELNTRRPLTIQGGMLKCFAIGQKDNNIGRAVTDVTIYPENDEPLYLSLKYGSTVTFVNVGIRKELPVQAIMDNAPQNFTQKGKMLLDLFGIDTDKFCNAFNSYSKKSSKSAKIEVDTTNNIDKKRLMEFIKSVVGYGYVLVHRDAKGKVHYYDMRTEKDMISMIGNDIESCIVKYPTSSEKRVDIFVELKGLSLKFNIRSKDGGQYPTHIMSDYKIKHWSDNI